MTTPIPPTEVPARPRRRSFTAEYKRRILREADTARDPGAIGALLRREGLYSSHLTEWRAARDRGDLAGDGPRRGPPPHVDDPRDARIVELERENARLQARLTRTETLLELQKKVAEMLSIALPPPPETP